MFQREQYVMEKRGERRLGGGSAISNQGALALAEAEGLPAR